MPNPSSAPMVLANHFFHAGLYSCRLYVVASRYGRFTVRRVCGVGELVCSTEKNTGGVVMTENEGNELGSDKKRIMIVDDHAVVREGLTRLICGEDGLDVCGGAQNAVEAMKILATEQVDLVIMDISIEGMNGIQLTEKIKSLYPDLPVIMLTIHDDPAYARRAFRAGAVGYIAKDEASESVIKAIRQVLSGRSYLSGRIVQQIIAAKAVRMFFSV